MHRPGDMALGLISGKRQHGDHVAQWRRLVKRQVTGREEKGRRTALESWSGQPGGGRRASLDRSDNPHPCMLLAPVHSLDPDGSGTNWEVILMSVDSEHTSKNMKLHLIALARSLKLCSHPFPHL